ncbi:MULTISPECIES: biotin--[acetyl-CoA-carboxylase] ligase [unclassified Aureimonas]|uniref:biotin--[acetyl-CoA-carboxylase] ligase n=1 Tax=unclassified Aureimonas TaxID=2615206 RepID=UPI000A9AAB07|nr:MULTISPECIES: biotin--[acetyl-CoA-carboxylase] ligase [unclassified Aureimonas]
MGQGRKAARRRLALDEVGSTNVVALEAARAGDPGPLWITAARQSAGRGRRGREWVSETGNLYTSLLLIDPAWPNDLLNLPLVVALGVRDGLAGLTIGDRPSVGIKWPNDILVDGRKSVGILIESERLSDGRVACVVGCGVNIEHCPENTPYPVTSLRLSGIPASVEAVFEALAEGVESALALWDGGRNFAAIRENWLSHAAGVGGPCTINLAEGSLTGRFVGLDLDGRLILEEDGGRRRSISAGDLFLLGAGGQRAAPDRFEPRH